MRTIINENWQNYRWRLNVIFIFLKNIFPQCFWQLAGNVTSPRADPKGFSNKGHKQIKYIKWQPLKLQLYTKMLARSNKRLRTFQRHDGWLNDQILHTKTVKSEKICRWGHVIFVSAFFNISVRQHDALSGLLKRPKHRLARARSNNLPTHPNILGSLQSKHYVLCTSW